MDNSINCKLSNIKKHNAISNETNTNQKIKCETSNICVLSRKSHTKLSNESVLKSISDKHLILKVDMDEDTKENSMCKSRCIDLKYNGKNTEKDYTESIYPDCEDIKSHIDDMNYAMDCRRNRKSRKIISREQLLTLSEEFVKNSYPDKREYQRFSKVLHLSEKSIRLWYQNQRAKCRRSGSIQQVVSKVMRQKDNYSHRQFNAKMKKSSAATEQYSQMTSRSVDARHPYFSFLGSETALTPTNSLPCQYDSNNQLTRLEKCSMTAAIPMETAIFSKSISKSQCIDPLPSLFTSIPDLHTKSMLNCNIGYQILPLDLSLPKCAGISL